MKKSKSSQYLPYVGAAVVILTVALLGANYFTHHSVKSVASPIPSPTVLPSSSPFPKGPVKTFMLSADGSFQIDFPVEPTVKPEEIPTSNGSIHQVVYEYLSKEKKEDYAVTSQTYTEGYLRGPVVKETLDAITTALGKNKNNTLVKTINTTVDGYPAKDEFWKIGKVNARMRNIVIGDTVFSIRVMTVTPTDSAAETFITSFKQVK
jgi:hypothetical protein